jgi:uncharacterized membrane protein YqjE
LFERDADLGDSGFNEGNLNLTAKRIAAMATPGTAINKRAEQPSEMENLPLLLTRLGDDVMQLFDTKMSLLKVEVRDDVNAFLRAGIMIAIAAMVALIGFALASVALALGISTQLANTSLTTTGRYGVSFVVLGVVYLIVGTIVALVMKGRLSKQSLVPNRTVDEFRKDKEWLKKEL